MLFNRLARGQVLKRPARNPRAALIIMSSLAGIGIYAVIHANAAISPAAFEAETGTISQPATTPAVTGASGGKVLTFGTPAPVSNTAAKGFGFAAGAIATLPRAEQDAWLADMKSLGITWLRIDIDWSHVQPNNAQSYDWAVYDVTVAEAAKYDIKVNGIITYTPQWASSCQGNNHCPPANMATFATYAKAVAQHFGSKLGAIEVWNEPNASSFWYPQTGAASYTTMLKLAYTAIKSVSPYMTVVSGGITPVCDCDGSTLPLTFANDMYAAGAKGYFDVFGDHPYSYPAPPTDILEWSGWSKMSQTSPSLRSIMVANGDAAKPVWMTEVGAPTAGSGAGGTCASYREGQNHTDECLQAKIISQIVSLSKGYDWSGVTLRGYVVFRFQFIY